jgi:dihydropteroate synthase
MTLIMGILNVTPDSFSDGGEHLLTPIDDAKQLLKDGADIIDIGGQSTRPGAILATREQELERVIPVVQALHVLRSTSDSAREFQISVDTMDEQVADKAIKAGADIINDVSLAAHPELLEVVAKSDVKYILMHSRGAGNQMQGEDYGVDVVETVKRELQAALDRVIQAGVKPENIIIDPGPGFSKTTPELNWPLLEHLSDFKYFDVSGQKLQFPVLWACSRKRFIGSTLPESAPGRDDAKARDVATAVTSAIATQKGAWAVRVHDVRGTSDGVAVVNAISNYTQKLNYSEAGGAK